MRGNAIRDWAMGIIGALAVAGVVGGFKLYSDIQVHFSLPSHAGTDARFAANEAEMRHRMSEIEAELRDMRRVMTGKLDETRLRLEFLAQLVERDLPE